MAIRFLALISLALGSAALQRGVSPRVASVCAKACSSRRVGSDPGRRQIGRIARRVHVARDARCDDRRGAVDARRLGTLHWIFKSAFVPALGAASLVALAMISLAVGIGLLTGRDVFAETPMAALRQY